MGCFYAVLSDKSQSTHEELFIAIQNDLDLEFEPDPTTVIMDYQCSFYYPWPLPHVHIEGCFDHLTQSTRKKIHSMGLVTLYRANEDVRHFCRFLDGLVFLPVDSVLDGLHFLKENIPDSVVTCGLFLVHIHLRIIPAYPTTTFS